MATISMRPISSVGFRYDHAQHLLNRAGFGGTPAEIQRLVGMGPRAAVDFLVDFDAIEDRPPELKLDPDIMRPPTPEERQAYRRARRANDEKALGEFRKKRMERQRADRQQLVDLRQWWFDRMATTPRPLEEKLTLLWHDHFAVNYRGCEDAYLLYQQNQMFRKHAAGSFADLARGIIRDPAMIVFLNNDRNRKQSPNENLARELMELFTLGVGNYREADIKEGARALTGYHRDDNKFRFAQAQHDESTKTILGNRGPFDGDAFVSICLAQTACSEFIAFKLYRHFVADVPDFDDLTSEQESVVKRLAADLRRHQYQLKPVLKELFLSEHFYDPAVRGQKIKSPVALVVGMLRVLDTPDRDTRILNYALKTMGQELFNPPNVAGWPGGRAWINTSTLFIRQNLATYLITGKPPAGTRWNRKNINYDATRLIASLDKPTPEAVVDHLMSVLLGAAGNKTRRQTLLKFLADHENRITNDSLIALLCLITAMPEFQLC
jgi:hypothetical protein